MADDSDHPDNTDSTGQNHSLVVFLGLLAAVAAITAPLAGLRLIQLVTAFFFVAMLIPVALLLSPWRRWPGLSKLYAGLLTITLLALGLWFNEAASNSDHSNPASRTPVARTIYRLPPPPKAPTIALVSPAQGDLSPVPGCLDVVFDAVAPSGYGFAVASQAAGDDRSYFQGHVPQDPATGRWSARMALGRPGAGMGVTYQISIVLVSSSLLSYLANMRADVTITVWSSLLNPPGSVPAAHFTVTRNNDAAMNC
jgi:hypothetical protein